MPRHINLRHHRYPSLGRIRNHFAYLVLRIKPSVRYPVIRVQVVSDACTFPERPLLGQQRIFPYLHPPALVIGQMPVENVHLVQLHDVYIPLDLPDTEKMPAYIKVHAPIPEPREIAYAAAWDIRIHLPQRLAGIIQPMQP